MRTEGHRAWDRVRGRGRTWAGADWHIGDGSLSIRTHVTTAKLDPTYHETTAGAGRLRRERLTLVQRLDAYISRLSTKNNFWHRVCSLIWLPYAFHSGIRMKRLDSKRFMAVLPFRRFNRNWYNAMAGAALLGNSEIAGGMYLFSEVGSDYIVVCKEMRYRFLRPCMGPAVYHVTNSEDLAARRATGQEFNITLDLAIRQRLRKKGRELRVGECQITFHCTPKALVRDRSQRRDRR